MRTKKIVLGSALLLAGLCVSCIGDLDFDKITSDVDMDMGVIVPAVNADVTVKDFANPEKHSAVKYYDTDYAKGLLRFQDKKSESFRKDIFSLIEIIDGEEYKAKELDLGETVAEDPEWSVTGEAMAELKVLIENDYVNIKKVVTSLDIRMETTGTSDSDIEMIFTDGRTVLFSSPKSAANKSLENVTIEVGEDGYATIPLKVKADKATTSLGMLKTTFIFTDIQSIVTSSSRSLNVNVPMDEMSTGMHGLKRFEKTVELQEPKILLYSTNSTNLKVAITPNVRTSDKKKKEELYVEPFTVEALADQQENVFTKENCDIQYVFNYLPEKLEVGADIVISIPEGVAEVEVKKNDNIVFGYGFDVPAYMKLKGTVEAESMKLEEVMDDLSDIENARIVTKSVSSFPACANVRIDFVNKNTDRVFGEPVYVEVMKAPEIDDNGLYKGDEATKVTITELTEKQVEQLRESSELIFMVELNEGLTEVPAVRFRKDDRLSVNVSLGAKFNVD